MANTNKVYLGGILIDALYLGENRISKLYLGENIIYDAEPSGPVINVDDYVTFEGGTATLLKRGKKLVNRSMRVEMIDKVDYKFNPEKITYTGATVGGVTTGGFHTTQASYSEVSTGNSGKAYIKITTLPDSPTLNEIILTNDELIESAKNNPRVAKFLQGNKLILKYENEKTKLTEEENYVLAEAIKTANQALQYGVTQRAFLEQQLTYSDCNQIILWLCGD